MLGDDHRPRFKEDRKNRCGVDAASSCSAFGILRILVVMKDTVGAQGNCSDHWEVRGPVFVRLALRSLRTVCRKGYEHLP
jgi:hypothetical protein